MQIVLFSAPFALSEADSSVSLSSDQLNQILAEARALNDGLLQAPNYAQAKQLFASASQAGSLEAKAWLGSMAMNGRGGIADYDSAKQLIMTSAEANNPVGLRFLGVLNQEGRGMPRNIQAAIDSYQKARAAGDGNSCGRLGMIYINGAGVAKDFNKGKNLLMEGASLGDVWSKVELGQLYATLSPPQLDKTKLFYQEAASQGSRLAAYRLGQIYQASGSPSDVAAAIHYYRQALTRRMAPAAVALAQMYESGLGLSIDLSRAYGLYGLAASQNNADGEDHLRRLAPRLTPDERRKGDALRASFERGDYGPE